MRAFAELFSITGTPCSGVDIEGPQDISERLTYPQLMALGASTWALQVAYLTVHTPDGDAIFEVDGLGPPELHARLSRVLQGLQRPSAADADRDRSQSGRGRGHAGSGRGTGPRREPDGARSSVAPVVIDPATSEAPLEILVVDALWKLDRVREAGLVNDTEAAALRNRILAQVPELAPACSAPTVAHSSTSERREDRPPGLALPFSGEVRKTSSADCSVSRARFHPVSRAVLTPSAGT